MQSVVQSKPLSRKSVSNALKAQGDLKKLKLNDLCSFRLVTAYAKERNVDPDIALAALIETTVPSLLTRRGAERLVQLVDRGLDTRGNLVTFVRQLPEYDRDTQALSIIYAVYVRREPHNLDAMRRSLGGLGLRLDVYELSQVGIDVLATTWARLSDREGLPMDMRVIEQQEQKRKNIWLAPDSLVIENFVDTIVWDPARVAINGIDHSLPETRFLKQPFRGFASDSDGDTDAPLKLQSVAVDGKPVRADSILAETIEHSAEFPHWVTLNLRVKQRMRVYACLSYVYVCRYGRDDFRQRRIPIDTPATHGSTDINVNVFNCREAPMANGFEVAELAVGNHGLPPDRHFKPVRADYDTQGQYGTLMKTLKSFSGCLRIWIEP